MDLLPNIDELKPISNNKNIFFDCGFNTNFNDISFEQKLQILCDIVRQSIYPNGHPNPDNDLIEMNGNCYTAAYCFIDYLKKLNITIDAKPVLVRKRSFDIDEVTSIHIAVLINSKDGHIYQVDPVRFAGYKFGNVEDITYKKTYDEYVVITDEIKYILYKLRKIIYDDYISNFNANKINEYIELCEIIGTYPILKGYVAKVLKIIQKNLDNNYDKAIIQEKINIIKPCNKCNIEKINEAK